MTTLILEEERRVFSVVHLVIASSYPALGDAKNVTDTKVVLSIVEFMGLMIRCQQIRPQRLHHNSCSYQIPPIHHTL